MRTYVFDCDYSMLGIVVQAVMGLEGEHELHEGRLEIDLYGPAGGNPSIRWTTWSPPDRVEPFLRTLLYGDAPMEDDEVFQVITNEERDAAWDRAFEHSRSAPGDLEAHEAYAELNWRDFPADEGGVT